MTELVKNMLELVAGSDHRDPRIAVVANSGPDPLYCLTLDDDGYGACEKVLTASEADALVAGGVRREAK